MKIQGPARNGLVENIRTPQPPGPENKQSNDGVSEHVHVSNEARLILDARAPEVMDGERVQRLQQQLENGTFQVDADKIAKRMLEEEV